MTSDTRDIETAIETMVQLHGPLSLLDLDIHLVDTYWFLRSENPQRIEMILDDLLAAGRVVSVGCPPSHQHRDQCTVQAPAGAR